MAKSSREYWRDREEAQRRHDITDEAEYRKEIERIYRQMMNEMQKELSDFYVKYATKNGITLSEAKRRAKRLDMQAYAEKAKEYVKNRDFSAQANAEMELYNMTMKTNRLELLKAELGMHVVGGYDEIQKYFEDKLSDRTLEEFRRQGGILAETVQANGELIDSIVNASFHHATFSERIWGQYAGFKAALDREITHGLIQGIGAEQLARNIQKTCVGVSSRDALRLMVTEMTRVRTEAARRSMERNGNTEYEFMALGRHPCPACKGLNGKIFKLKDLMPGENAPPMHPWCHCSTAPHWDEETYQAWLDSGAAKAGVPFEEFAQSNDRMSHRADIGEWQEPGERISESELSELVKYGAGNNIDVKSFENYDGNIELIKSFIDGIVEVAKDYPEILNGKRPLQLRCSYQMDPSDYAETTNNCITLNGNAFRNKDALKEDYDKQQEGETPFFVKGTSYKNISHHEAGHLIVKRFGLSAQRIAGGSDNFSISDYADKSPGEAIAESFSAHYAGVLNKKASIIKQRCDTIISERRTQK